MSDDLLADVVSFSRQLREQRDTPVGTAANPYVVVVPKWFEDRCVAEGTTAQDVYDQTYRGSSFQHGRVEIMEDYS